MMTKAMMAQVGPTKYELTMTDGTVVELGLAELGAISDFLRRAEWRSGIDDVIGMDEDDLDFEKMPEDEFIDACIDELQMRWECCELGNVCYDDIVNEIANEYGLWKE